MAAFPQSARNFTGKDFGDFDAIPELARSDAQVDLLFLTNNEILYLEPITDPFFKATKLVRVLIGLTNNEGSLYEDYYTPHEPVSVLGCATQYTICNPSSTVTAEGLCSPHTDIWAAFHSAENDLHLSSRQMGVLNRIIPSLINNGMNSVAANVGEKVLLASQKAFGNLGAALPSNQWIKELDHFLAINMVAAQYKISQYAGGAGYPTPSQNIQGPTATDSWMCSNQVIQRDDFTSFRMIGVIIILVVGGLLIVLDTTVHPFLSWFEKKKTSGKLPSLFRDHDWKYSSAFHTQAYAYDLLGLGGTWDMDGLVPTTKEGTRFGPVWKTFEGITGMAASPTQSDLESGSVSKNTTLAESPVPQMQKMAAEKQETGDS